MFVDRIDSSCCFWMATHCSMVCGCENFGEKYGQYAPPKRHYSSSIQHGVITYRNIIQIFMSVRTLNCRYRYRLREKYHLECLGLYSIL